MWWHGGICWCVKNIPPHWPYLLENITYDMDEIYLIRLFFLCSHAHNSCSPAHGSCSWAHEITSLCGVLSFNPSATIVELGRFTIGVHKRNVSPQNHSQNTTLNYIYEKIYLVDFYMLDIHIFWLKWWWFLWFGWLTCPWMSWMMVHQQCPLSQFYWKRPTWLTIFVQIVPYFDHK